MLSGLDLYYADPAEHGMTAAWDLDDLQLVIYLIYLICLSDV